MSADDFDDSYDDDIKGIAKVITINISIYHYDYYYYYREL